MYLLFRRGVINGGQWGPVNDYQATIVSENMARLGLVIAKKMYPDAEAGVEDVEGDFTFSLSAFKEKAAENDEDEEYKARIKAMEQVGGLTQSRMNDPALWRADFDPEAYLEANPL